MAYSTDNPPRLISQSVGADGGAVWLYLSTDAAADIDTSGYFTDGYDLGMRENDLVFAVKTDDAAKATSLHTVVSATESGGVDLSDDIIAGTSANTD